MKKSVGQWIILHQRQPTVRSKAGPCQERFITLSARERLRIKVSGLDKSPQLCMTIYVGHISTVGGFIFIYFYLRNNQQVFRQVPVGVLSAGHRSAEQTPKKVPEYQKSEQVSSVC